MLLGLERWAFLSLDAFSRRYGLGREQQPARAVIGERGELEAIFYLRRCGYRVVEWRWRAPESRGDLDLVAWEGETLCFIEVKTLTQRGRTPAGLAVDRDKHGMMREMSRAYRRMLPRAERLNLQTRFDVVSVYLLAGGAEFELVRGVSVEQRRS
jgi:putative endonuclease